MAVTPCTKRIIRPPPDKPACRRVLFVAYFYPPSGGAGVQRPLKFAKYLPHFGWQAHVVTVADGCFFARDDSLVREVAPLGPITRTWSLELERLAILRRARAKQSQAATLAPSWSHPLRQKFLRMLNKSRALLVPDAQVGWIPFAWHAAQAICRAGHIDAVWTSSAPYSCHIVGLLLKQHLGLPWIADFRDAWSDNPMSPGTHQRVHRGLELRVLKQADRVVGVSDEIVEYLARRTVNAPDKYHTIANGYDVDDFNGPAVRAHGPICTAPFVLTMTGSLYSRISAVPFYEGLAEFFFAHPAARHQTQVRWVGQMDRQAREDSNQAVRRLDLGRNVAHVGYVSHSAAIAELWRADVLLLLLFCGAGASQVMTGKVFEYLAAQKPILAMAQGTAAAKIIAACQAGIVTHPQDPKGIARALGQLWQRRQQPWPLSAERQAILQPYTRQALSGQLARLLDSVAC